MTDALCEACNESFTVNKAKTRFCKRDACKKLRQRARWVKWYAKEDTRLKINKYQQNYRYKTKNIAGKHWELNAKYGVGIDYWEAMLDHADYKCEICEQENDLVFDHCHTTGVARGVLCRNCNAGIGNLKESYTFVVRAAAYLKERANGIPALMDRVFSEDGKPRFEQGCLFSEAGGGDSYVSWQSTDKRRVQWHSIWSPPLR